MPQSPVEPRWPKILSLAVHEFRTDMGSELREVFAVRAAYLEARARVGLSLRSGPAAGS